MSRKAYNKAIFLTSKAEGEERLSPNKFSVKKVVLDSLPEYCKEVPYQIKSMAAQEACQNVSKAIQKYRRTGEIQDLKFRSRKATVQSFYVPKEAISEGGIYPTILGKGLKFAEKLPTQYLSSRIVYKYGRWFLSVPYKIATQSFENQGRIVALDPGIRKFLTYYSEDSVGFIGNQASKYLFKRLLGLDSLASKVALAKGKKKYRLKKAERNERFRVKNLINELHWKTAHFLTSNFDVILLPDFRSQEMVFKRTRKLKVKSVRQMLTLSHYSFSLRLEQKCAERGKTLLRVNEAYTSKTVSWNGFINHNLGSKETISSGGVTMDRDLNGARGIFLRALVDHPKEFDITPLQLCS